MYPLPPMQNGGKEEQMKNSKKTKQVAETTYTYYRWDEELKKEVPVNITTGQDRVTEEYIILLNEMDHETALSERYEYENRDYGIENQKNKFDAVPDETVGDPIENLGTRKTDPSYFLEKDKEVINFKVEQLLMLMQELTPQQIDLIYSIYGESRFMADIAREEGKTVQAISNRKDKIINRLKKLFDELDKKKGA